MGGGKDVLDEKGAGMKSILKRNNRNRALYTVYLLWPRRVIISAGSMGQDIVSKDERPAVALCGENIPGIRMGWGRAFTGKTDHKD